MLKIRFDLEDDFEYYKKDFFQSKSQEKEVFTHHVQAVFVKNNILLYLTLKWSF